MKLKFTGVQYFIENRLFTVKVCFHCCFYKSFFCKQHHSPSNLVFGTNTFHLEITNRTINILTLFLILLVHENDFNTKIEKLSNLC